jgi:hypothetical protein
VSAPAIGEVVDSSVRLRLQRLPAPLQVLAVGRLVQARAADDSFTTRDIAELFVQLRLPPVANYSATLGRLRNQGFAMNPQSGRWAITPAGEHKLDSEASAVAATALHDSLAAPRGAAFGEVRHTTIPPFLGPDGMSAGINSVLATSPFENNVMLITRFPKNEDDHFGGLIDAIRVGVAKHGLVLHVASDANARDTLWENVVTYMWACKYAIVLVDASDGYLNSNVMIEVGGMLMTGRRCAILRDVSVPAMPSDLVGHIYKPVELSDHKATLNVIDAWIKNDLGLS